MFLVRPKHLQSKFEDSQVVYAGDATDKAAIEAWITKVIKTVVLIRSRRFSWVLDPDADPAEKANVH